MTIRKALTQKKVLVSVPIRGLFNLTYLVEVIHMKEIQRTVSVPIRGLFNLTLFQYEYRIHTNNYTTFPSPSGDYLI